MSSGKLITALSFSLKRFGKCAELITARRTHFTVTDFMLMSCPAIVCNLKLPQACRNPRSTFQSRACQLPLSCPQLVKRNLFTMKVDTEDFRSIFTDELIQLQKIFEKNNYEIRFAGGPVRYSKMLQTSNCYVL